MQAKEAKLEFHAMGYHIVEAGSFVRCAVTKKVIPLEKLMYWSVERQEAYYDPQAANQKK